MHAHIRDGQILQVGALPRIWWDGARYWDWRTDQATAEAQGWVEVQRSPRPEDTATQTHDYTVELVDGVPVEVWTPRDKTPDEIAADTAAAVEQTLRQQVHSEIQTLRQATGLDDTPGTSTARGVIATPNPDINNSPAQYIKAVARLLRGSNRAQIRNLRLTLGDYSTPADD